MSPLDRVRAQDRALIRIVSQAMDEAARRSGPWLACRLGCTKCCIGTFPITQLDALRLQDGWRRLSETDPARAQRVIERARQAAARYGQFFPAGPCAGVFSDDEEAEEAFHELAGEDPCPALDPETGACDLYDSRPITCRTFGPEVLAAGRALGHCDLCYVGASPDQIAACQVDFDPDGVEAFVLEELERATGAKGYTLVAFALASADST